MHLRMSSLSLGPKPITAARRAVLHRRVRLIVAATITYNVLEAVVALTAGTIASSSALIGFGLDSIVEVLSAAAVAWQFAAPDPHRRERAAMRVIAFSFFGLAAFVTVDAVRALLGAAEPEHSPVGIALAAVSLVVMPALSWFERRTGREMGSASAVLLVGLVLNSTLGWSWADPLAALVIAAVAVREGLEAWRGDACCSPVAVLLDDGDDEDDDGCAGGCGSGCACCAPPR
jgi:divalent metal cation (Fe/Co/Zn/Cd) transporter